MENHTSPRSPPAGSLVFCIKAVTTAGGDKVCVPVGLTLLSALVLLLSCLLVIHQTCKYRGHNPGGAITVFYCFHGNLCSAVGAMLSTDLHLQVLMGVLAAAVDALSCMLFCVPLLLCWNSKTERRLRMVKRRRRQHLLASSLFIMVAGGFLTCRVTDTAASRPVKGRNLLHAPLQDNTETLGYILGLLSLVISCTSRFPALCRAYGGHALTQTSIWSHLLCSLAGAFYTAAILLHDTRFEFLLRVMPWLLSSVGCAALDLLLCQISVSLWCRKRNCQAVLLSSDTESLLGDSGIIALEETAMKSQKNQSVPSSTPQKIKHAQKISAMGFYMDVQSPRKEEVEIRPVNRMVRMTTLDSVCSSCDSSPVSSDLEWDFEAANAQWRESASKQPEKDKFALQEWPVDSDPSRAQEKVAILHV